MAVLQSRLHRVWPVRPVVKSVMRLLVRRQAYRLAERRRMWRHLVFEVLFGYGLQRILILVLMRRRQHPREIHGRRRERSRMLHLGVVHWLRDGQVHGEGQYGRSSECWNETRAGMMLGAELALGAAICVAQQGYISISCTNQRGKWVGSLRPARRARSLI